MARKAIESNRKRQEEELKRKIPDCCVCIHRNGCERYQANSYCTRFQSRDPEYREPDPNRLWETGEEVEI